MAYYNPESSPLNDWDDPVVAGPTVSESKALHSNPPLTTNQLTNALYTPMCRKFVRAYGGIDSYKRYMLKNIPANADFINDSAAVAISGVFRKFAVDNGSCGPILLLRHTGSTNNYTININFSGVERLNLYGNRGDASTAEALSKTVTGLIDEDDWFGMRLIATTEGLDVRLRVYLALGAAVLNSLDANDEPAWTEIMSCRHQSGSVTPQEPVGHTSAGTFGTTTPALSGTPGFGFSGAYNGTDTWYYDAIRVKRLA